ncbi:hypothetical protein P7C73_g2807, partial [Tremellales sp. Uapishka_1]
MERVRDNPQLLSCLIECLDLKSLGRILTVNRTCFDIASRVLYRRAPLWVVEGIDEKSSRGPIYCAAVRAIDATMFNKNHELRRKVVTPEGVAEYQAKCSNLISIDYLPSKGKWSVDRFTITLPRDGKKGLFDLLEKTELCLHLPFDEEPELSTMVEWPNYKLDHKIVVNTSERGRAGYNNDPIHQYTAWLKNGHLLDKRISGLEICEVPLTIMDFEKICSSRVDRGARPISRIIGMCTQPFSLDELSSFLNHGGEFLEDLDLSHFPAEGGDWYYPPKISLTDLGPAIDLFRSSCPNLKRLQLVIRGDIKGRPILGSSMPSAQHDRKGTLQHVTIVMPIVAKVQRAFVVPVLVLSRQLACLGGPDCKYELAHGTDWPFQTFLDITAAVKSFQAQVHTHRSFVYRLTLPYRLTNVQFDAIRNIDLQDIGVFNLQHLRELSFDLDGRPITSAKTMAERHRRNMPNRKAIEALEEKEDAVQEDDGGHPWGEHPEDVRKVGDLWEQVLV